MSATLALLGFALVLGHLGPRWLARASWPTRAPKWGMVAWQAMTWSVYSSLVLAGVALAAPEIPGDAGLEEFFHACSAAWQDHYASPGGIVSSVAGTLTAGTLIGRFVFVLTRAAVQARDTRRRHCDTVRLVGAAHPEPDVTVLEHDLPAAYCLPGRHNLVVLTRGAVDALSPVQMDQVLSHERAHLRSRHHLVLLFASALSTTLFGRLGTGMARDRLAELAEMHADDATDPARRVDLATALVLLAGGQQPVGALGAGGSALARVRRLAAPGAPVSARHRAGVACLAATAVVVPLALAVLPGVAAAIFHSCPLFV